MARKRGSLRGVLSRGAAPMADGGHGLVPGLRVVRRESVDPLRDGAVSGLFRSPPLPAGRGGAAAARAPLRLALAESDEEPDAGGQGPGMSPPPLRKPRMRGIRWKGAASTRRRCHRDRRAPFRYFP